jgi:hypothetical protein
MAEKRLAAAKAEFQEGFEEEMKLARSARAAAEKDAAERMNASGPAASHSIVCRMDKKAMDQVRMREVIDPFRHVTDVPPGADPSAGGCQTAVAA